MNKKTISSRIKSEIRRRLHIKVPFKVNLFIVGEQKCGTTSLHNLLCNSKEIVGGEAKEMHFFDCDNFNKKKIKEYENKFRYHILNGKPSYALDSSPSYAWRENALNRILEYNPDSKIIYLTRNPVQRFISAYKFYSSIVKYDNPLLKISKHGQAISNFIKQNPDFTIEVFFEIEISSKPLFYALDRGCYHAAETKIKSLFDADQYFHSSLEKLSDSSTSRIELARLHDFLGLELPIEVDFPRSNPSFSQLEQTPKYILQFLENYYADHSDS